MEIPAPDPSKLLQAWMEWERGDVTPGRVMSNLKTGGLRPLLESLVGRGGSAGAGPEAIAPKVGAVAAPGVEPASGAGQDAPVGSHSAGSAGTSDGQPASWVPIV